MLGRPVMFPIMMQLYIFFVCFDCCKFDILMQVGAVIISGQIKLQIIMKQLLHK